jgi:hypothetical protein
MTPCSAQLFDPKYRVLSSTAGLKGSADWHFLGVVGCDKVQLPRRARKVAIPQPSEAMSFRKAMDPHRGLGGALHGSWRTA